MKLKHLLFLASFGTGLVFSACNKIQNISSVPPVAKSSTDSSLVLTPEGYVPAYKVHHIEKGYALMRNGGHMLKVEAKSRTVIEDYGEIQSPTAASSSTSTATKGGVMTTTGGPDQLAHRVLPTSENPGWVTNAYAPDPISTPISYLITAWVVPNLPATTTDGQTLFFFNGLEPSNGSDIVQPVLQWGSSDAGNANGWGIANWYVWSGGYAVSDLISVLPGAILEGAITYTGQNGSGSYDYTSTFYNLSTNAAYDNSLSVIEGDDPSGYVIPSVVNQTYATETLEAYNSQGVNGGYGVVQASDYPAGQNYLDMYDILVNVGGTSESVGWTVVNNNTPFGENTQTVPGDNNSTNGGTAIYLYWHPVPTIDGLSNINLTTTNTSYTVSGYPGNTVNIFLEGSAINIRGGGINGTTTCTMTITTPGVTFSDGSTTITTVNNLKFATATMPASGSFTVNASYTTTATGGTLIAETHAF